MFTSCPECGTVFRVTTTELRQAEGYVRCGHCSATFNAVASITDQPPDTDGLADTADQPVPAVPPEAAPERPAATTPQPEPASTEREPDADSLEFNVPEDNWSEFFITELKSGPEPGIEPEALPEDEEAPPDPLAGAFRDATDEAFGVEATGAGVFPALELRAPVLPDPPGTADTDIPVSSADGWNDPPEATARPEPPSAEDPETHFRAVRPLGWDAPAAEAPRRRGWVYALGSLVLGLALVAQLIHLQRDSLATEPALLAPLQRLYDALGMPLMPAWDLRSYEVRNLEAVAGRSDRDTLEIQGRVAIVGNAPAGLPLLRVRLHDRFGKTLGSRLVQPADYLRGSERPQEPISPGVLIPIRISLKDPGPDAYGYDLDVCLQNRPSGLLCQLERDPFAR